MNEADLILLLETLNKGQLQIASILDAMLKRIEELEKNQSREEQLYVTPKGSLTASKN